MAARDRDSARCLLPADARAMLRMGNALHRAPPDPAARKRLLLDGLSRLVGADSAPSVVTAFDPTTARRIIVSVAETVEAGAAGMAGAAGTATGGPAGGTSPPPEHPRPPHPPEAGPGQSVDSFIDLRGMQVVATLTVTRRGSGRRFTRRDREIVEVMHSESAWIYGHDLLRVSPEVLALPPRERQTLQLLAAGRVERQVAADLGLSTNTVHHYVKSLYRRFGAASRDELLARWLH